MLQWLVPVLYDHTQSAIETIIKTQLVGRTRGDQVVVLDGLSLKGRLLNVTVVSAQSMALFAEMLYHDEVGS